MNASYDLFINTADTADTPAAPAHPASGRASGAGAAAVSGSNVSAAPAGDTGYAALEMARMRSDPQWSAKLASGDRAATAYYASLQRAIHDGAALPFRPAAAPATQPDAALAADAVNGHAPLVEPGDAPADGPVDLEAAAYAPPASPDGYVFDKPYGLQVDTEAESAFRRMAHSVQMPAFIAREFYGAWNAAAANPPTAEAIAAQRMKTEAALREELGDAATDTINKARSVLQALPDNLRAQAISMLEQSGLGNDINLVRRLARLAEVRAKGKR